MMNHLKKIRNTAPQIASRAFLATASLAIVSWMMPAAWAQEGQNFTSNPEGTSVPLLNELSSGLRYQNDLFAGQNKPGPYNLTWNNVRVSKDEKVTVVLDGTVLKPEEFTVDAAKGTITFTRPITDKQVVRVNYIYDVQTSKRNGGIATSQFSLSVARLAGTQVQVTALPDVSGSGTSGVLPLVWGANRRMNLFGGGLTTQLNFADAKGSGSKLGYALGNDRNGVTADFSRTEKVFATSVGKTLGMAEAMQKWSVATRLAPSKWFNLNYGSSASDDLSSDVGKENENFGVRLGGIKNLPTLAFTRNEDTNIDAQKAEVNVTTEKLALDANVNKGTKVNAAQTTTATDAAKAENDVTVTAKTLALDTNLNKGTKVNAATTTTKTDAATDANDVTVTAKSLALDTKLNTGTKVNATTTTTTTDAATEANNVTVTEKAIALNTASKDNVKKADLSLNTNNKETANGVETKQDIKIRLQPAPVFVLSAGQLSQRNTPVSKDGKPVVAQRTITQTAGAELMPLAGTKLTGSYSETARDDVRVSSTDVGAQLWTGKRVELTGGIVNRSTEVENQNVLDTTRAKIALKPWDTVTLTGSYIWNPEEQGQVKQSFRQEIGFNAKVGALELGSGYAMTTINGLQNFTDSPQFGQVSLSLGLRFNRLTRLDGMYKDSLRYGMRPDIAAGLIPNYVKSYGFGLTHGVGDAFNFKLGGSISEDRSQQKDPKEMKAEAKLGVKF